LVEYEGRQGPRKFVESWRWRYRDPKTGRICRTLFQLSEREAGELPQAERIEGSMSLPVSVALNQTSLCAFKRLGSTARNDEDSLDCGLFRCGTAALGVTVGRRM